MSQFYTNIQLAGDTILYRGYDNGEPVQFRSQFSPTLYVTSQKDENRFFSVNHQAVELIASYAFKKEKIYSSQ